MCWTVVAAGLSAAGSLVSGMQAAAAGRYNEQVARNNAIAASQKASFEAGLIRQRGEETTSQATAALGKAGVDLGASTSAQAVLGKSVENTELDAAAELYSGQLDANAYLAQAKLARMQGQQQMFGGILSAGSTLLTGLSRRGGGSTYGTGGLLY